MTLVNPTTELLTFYPGRGGRGCRPGHGPIAERIRADEVAYRVARAAERRELHRSLGISPWASHR